MVWCSGVEKDRSSQRARTERSKCTMPIEYVTDVLPAATLWLCRSTHPPARVFTLMTVTEPRVQGILFRTLKGHGHWVNTMALNTDYVLRTGAYDHTGTTYEDLEERTSQQAERAAVRELANAAAATTTDDNRTTSGTAALR